MPSLTVRSTPTSWPRPGATDQSDFHPKYEPGHPAADASGKVKHPNVNPLVEMTDMREAQRSNEANVNVISAPADGPAHPRYPQSLMEGDPCTTPAAANAYANSARLRDPTASIGASPSSDTKFGDVLKDVISSVSQAAQKSDGGAAGRRRRARPT